MTKETEEAVNALLGGEAPANAGAEDWKAKYEESQRQLAEKERELNSAKVERGRVAKLDAELKALRSQKTEKDLIESLPEEQRAELPDGITSAAAKIAMSAVERERQATEERIAKLEQERKAEREQQARAAMSAFTSRVEAAYPGFIQQAMLGGGKNNQAWKAYLTYNQESVRRAWATCDLATLEYHIKNFYNTVLEAPIPSADRGNATASDPSANKGGSSGLPNAGGKKTYTQEEYAALERAHDEAEAARDYAKAREISRELDLILSEGRLKG